MIWSEEAEEEEEREAASEASDWGEIEITGVR